jgi:transposase
MLAPMVRIRRRARWGRADILHHPQVCQAGVKERLITNIPKIYVTNGAACARRFPCRRGDFRGIGRAAQEALRRALVLLEREGMSQGEAARAVGVQRQTVNRWLKRWRAAGEEGVLDGRRVSPRRGKGILSAEESRQVRRWIADKTPDQLKLPFALWTSRAVRDLIERRFAKRLGLSTVQLYLRRWGMTPQKPLARARERAPAAIQAWLEVDYPATARRAKAEGAMIYWGDETGITKEDQIGRTWAPRGQTPVVARRARRISQSLISAVNNRGLMRFMLTGGARGPHSPAGDGALNAERFIAFLTRLMDVMAGICRRARRGGADLIHRPPLCRPKVKNRLSGALAASIQPL